jgi:hypothetical protein
VGRRWPLLFGQLQLAGLTGTKVSHPELQADHHKQTLQTNNVIVGDSVSIWYLCRHFVLVIDFLKKVPARLSNLAPSDGRHPSEFKEEEDLEGNCETMETAQQYEIRDWRSKAKRCFAMAAVLWRRQRIESENYTKQVLGVVLFLFSNFYCLYV